jgi:hypothetical protein
MVLLQFSGVGASFFMAKHPSGLARNELDRRYNSTWSFALAPSNLPPARSRWRIPVGDVVMIPCQRRLVVVR